MWESVLGCGDTARGEKRCGGSVGVGMCKVQLLGCEGDMERGVGKCWKLCWDVGGGLGEGR